MKEKIRDPICGTSVNPKNVNWRYKFGVQTYYFCTLDCLITFDDNPDEFVSQAVGSKGI